MASILRPVAVSLAMLASLSGCDVPQGVPNASQVLAGADDPSADFAVVPVTSATLATIAKWPAQPPVTPTVGWLPPGGGVSEDIVIAGDTVDVGMFSNEQNGLLTNPGEKFVRLPAIMVNTAGSLILPYAGEVHVGGLTTEQARLAIQNKLVTVMPSVQVTLVHHAGRNNSVQVVSGLPEAGIVPLPDHAFTVLDAITAKGGVPDSMRNPEVQVARGGRLYGIAFSKLVEHPQLNAVLRPGDRIYVVPDKRYFLSMGQSAKVAQIRFPEANVNALEAVSLIGGLISDAADARGVLVLRQYPPSAVRKDASGPSRQRMIFAFNLLSADGLFSAGQFQIQNKDVILVTQSPLVNSTQLANALSKMLGLPIQSMNLFLKFHNNF